MLIVHLDILQYSVKKPPFIRVREFAGELGSYRRLGGGREGCTDYRLDVFHLFASESLLKIDINFWEGPVWSV